MPMQEMESQKKVEDVSQEQAQNGQETAAGSDAQASNEQKSQGHDLAHGNVSELLARGESTSPKGGNNQYDAMNYYRSDGSLGNCYFGLIDGSPISSLTFGRLAELSKKTTLNISYTDGDEPTTLYNARLFATGKYQMVPDTREAAKVAAGLNDNSVFSAQNQDLCFTNYLIAGKRPQVMAYLTGNGSIEAAALAIAQEWAAVGIAPGLTNNNGIRSDGTVGYYNGDGLNSASITYSEIIAALKADKAAIESGGVATHTIDPTVGTPQSVLPGPNATAQGGNATADAPTPAVSEGNVAAGESSGGANVDIDRAVRINKRYGYKRITWIEIQRGIGMPEDQVDGYVGPITAQAIADWQASRGFTGDDLDGICGPNTLKAIRAGMPAVNTAVSSDPTAQSAVENPSSANQNVSDEPSAAETPAVSNQPAETPSVANEGPAETASGTLSDAEVADAVAWNNARNYSEDTISVIKSTVGGASGSSFTAEDAQKIAAWQQSQGLTGKDVDGKFGPTSCGLAGITPTYNVSNYHTLGSDTPTWCTQHGFINGQSLDQLEGNFRESAKSVIGGIQAAGGAVTITSTLRHPARAAVMYYARYLEKTAQVQDIFNQHGISVDGNWAGGQAACAAFGIGSNPVGLTSNHIYGHAVDMQITNLPASISVGGTTVSTGGNQGGYVSNANALNNALRNAGVASDFIWYGYGDDVHWSINGR